MDPLKKKLVKLQMQVGKWWLQLERRWCRHSGRTAQKLEKSHVKELVVTDCKQNTKEK
jgi:hypothetical protein